MDHRKKSCHLSDGQVTRLDATEDLLQDGQIVEVDLVADYATRSVYVQQVGKSICMAVDGCLTTLQRGDMTPNEAKIRLFHNECIWLGIADEYLRISVKYYLPMPYNPDFNVNEDTNFEWNNGGRSVGDDIASSTTEDYTTGEENTSDFSSISD